MSDRVMGHLRTGHLDALALGIALIVAGMALIFGGLWLNWDFVNSVFFLTPINHPDWRFCLPVYVACYPVAEWSAPFDIAMGIIIVGACLELLGAFIAFITFENMQ